MPRGGRGSHSTSVPVPLTQSALDARKSFYCELCGKGYGRMNEFEAHESSYDHQHKKRFMEMKQMQRGSSSVEARRERERRAEEKAGLITIKPLRQPTEKNFPAKPDDVVTRPGKKGFKSAFGNEDTAILRTKQSGGFKKAFGPPPDNRDYGVRTQAAQDLGNTDFNIQSDTDDSDYELYDPSRPTI
ncbi:hypothetical protein TWF694_000021 [Orbilia ellipsospora]|uniref:C2H2-type domain-containing protein n=1 Tax=Orbilia ellipsospora TaxID=2528407 RepID=A0AAV9XMR5_9PEZI